jgi:hypothetical protein
VCDTRSYLNLAAQVSIGPWPDCPSFKSLISSAAAKIVIAEILADAGYDSEPNHEFAAALGIRSIMPPEIGRTRIDGPKGPRRRKLWKRFPRKRYGGRAHVEGTYSQDKRRFGSQLRATSVKGQWGELMMRVLIHNTALLLCPRRRAKHQPTDAAVFNRASLTPFSFPGRKSGDLVTPELHKHAHFGGGDPCAAGR